MRRLVPAAAVLAVLVGLVAGQAAGFGESTPTTPAAKTPRWVTHVARYPGGISGTVRAVYAAQHQNGAPAAANSVGAKSENEGTNVQMNDDSYPPMPQRRFIVQRQPNDAENVKAPTAASPSSCIQTWCSEPV